MKKIVLVFLISIAGMTCGYSKQVITKVYSTQDTKQLLGTVTFEDTPHGLLILPDLAHLPAGLRGFHLHQHADCAQQGMCAGGHFDPENTNTHQGPYGKGHRGDLPVLYVKKDGTATTPTLAPRLKTSDLKGLAVMIHAGGDNYSDHPPLGGGGARIACGTLP